MPKLNTTRHDLFHDGQGRMFANRYEEPRPTEVGEALATAS
jgi:hypothetical protein